MRRGDCHKMIDPSRAAQPLHIIAADQSAHAEADQIEAAPGQIFFDEIRELCLRAYAHAGNHGLARVDCFVDLEKPAGEQVLLNEINTLPGFTATSVYSRLWAASGLAYGELLDELLTAAVARPRRLPIG